MQQGARMSDPYEPTVQDIGDLNAEMAAFKVRYAVPPCLECGAVTLEEAQNKCNSNGHDCHGCCLWPYDATPNSEGA